MRNSGLSLSLTLLHNTTFSLDFLVLFHYMLWVFPTRESGASPEWQPPADWHQFSTDLEARLKFVLQRVQFSTSVEAAVNTVLILLNLLINSHLTRHTYWIRSYNLLIPPPDFHFSVPKLPIPYSPTCDVFYKNLSSWEYYIHIHIDTPHPDIHIHF